MLSSQAAGNLSKLLHHTPEFRWFLDTCIKPMLEYSQEKALDVDLPLSLRDIHANIRIAIKEIYEWPEEQLKMAQARKNVLDKPK